MGWGILMSSHHNKRSAIGIFGKQGQGKSALEHQLVREYQAKGGKVLAYDRAHHFGNASEWWGSHRAQQWLEARVLGKHRGLLVLDDADIYMTSRTGGVMRDMIASFRHYDLDLIVSARMPQGIDTTLLACLDKVCVFFMTSPHGLKHLDDLLGGDFPGFQKHLPKEKFQYMEFDLNTGKATMRHTIAI